MKLSGTNVEFAQLVDPEYVDLEIGSRLDQLKRIAEEHGLSAIAAGNLTTQLLRHSPYPIVLHVKTDIQSRQYNHYELYLGAKADKAILYDPPNPIRLEPFYMLKLRWDGSGLVVSTEPLDRFKLFLPAWKQILLFGVVVVTVLAALQWGVRRWIPLFRRTTSGHHRVVISIAESGALFALAMVASLAYHHLDNSGFLIQAQAIASIQESRFVHFVPKLDAKDIEHFLKSDTIFVDARYPRDFDSGHLEGAINLPVNASAAERQRALAGISREARIVTYCQSASCEYAVQVAKSLASDGFDNIALFKGGWQEWQAYNTH